jgi:hypothetical protein
MLFRPFLTCVSPNEKSRMMRSLDDLSLGRGVSGPEILGQIVLMLGQVRLGIPR